MRSMFLSIDFEASAMYTRSAVSHNPRQIGRLFRQTLIKDNYCNY